MLNFSKILAFFRQHLFVIFFVVVMVSFYLFNHHAGHLITTHLIFSASVLTLFFLHLKSRNFVVVSLPLIAKEMCFDTLRYIPFEWLKPIRVVEPYQIDKTLFGISLGGEKVLLNEYFLTLAKPVFDLISGVLYHVLDPVAYTLLILLWGLNSRGLAQRYGVAFLVMNFFAFFTYIFYPAAAPWYVAKYGFAQPLGPVLGDPAGLIHFDHILGVELSSKIYSSSPVVFGAIPSMHAGFTMLGWLYSYRLGRKWFFGFGIYTLAMWFSALYLQHHYMLDVVVGIAYALMAYIIVEKIFLQKVTRLDALLSTRLVHSSPKPLWSLRGTK